MTYKIGNGGHSSLSNFEKMRIKQGYTLATVSAMSGVPVVTLRGLRTMDPKKLVAIKMGSIMRVAMVLRCRPSVLIPALNRVPKNVIKKRQGYARWAPKGVREVNVEDCAPNMTGEVIQSEDL